LYAGPPTGPFTLVTENFSNTLVWQLVQGNYVVPAGQSTTRFIFRVKNYDIGHLLDAANFKANTNIITQNTLLPCTNNAMSLSAEGVGQWVADPINPANTIIATPNSPTTNVSGLTIDGNYIYHWKTRYCDKTVTITYQGISEVPQVVSPINLCRNSNTSALTANVGSGYSLLWYTQETGGVGSAIAPVPNTSLVGSTIYYVSAVSAAGCIGPRVPLTVTINEQPTASISGTTSICSGTTASITFNGTANATVTYTIDGGSNQTIVLNGSGPNSVTTPSLTANSTYALVSVASSATPTCSQTLTGSAIVTVNALPTASISGTTSICSGTTANITFNGTANATVTYTINGGSNQTIVLNGSGTNSVTTPSLTANSTYALVSVASSGTPTCNQTLTGSAIVTVNALPTASISGTTSICSGTTASITFNGTANATVTYTINGGSNQTIVLNGSGTNSVTTPS
jgi:ribosomal protein S8E